MLQLLSIPDFWEILKVSQLHMIFNSWLLSYIYVFHYIYYILENSQMPASCSVCCWNSPVADFQEIASVYGADITRAYVWIVASHTAADCNSLQLTATHYNTLQLTATHYNTLQLTATHCNALLAHELGVRKHVEVKNFNSRFWEISQVNRLLVSFNSCLLRISQSQQLKITRS